MQHRTMLWLSEIVEQAGATVVRFNFPYRVLGRSMPDRMPALMEAYRCVITSVREKLQPKRLIIGGHSMGGRVASMIASEGDKIDGLLMFGYPLHPPGRQDKIRDAHLPSIRCPALQVSGTRDELCDRDLMEKVAVGSNYQVLWIEGGDHSYSIAKSSDNTKADARNEIAKAVREFLA